MLVHSGDKTTTRIAKAICWTITRATKRCKSCQVAKSKQNLVPKKSSHELSKTLGEILHLDISSIKNSNNSNALEKKTGL